MDADADADAEGLRGWEFCPISPFFANFSTFTNLHRVPSFQAHSPVKTRDFKREARDTVASGSSEALRRLRRMQTRFYKLEDAYSQMWRKLELEKDTLKSLYGVKMVDGY